MKIFGKEVDNSEDKEAERKVCAHVRQLVDKSRAGAARIAHESIWMTNTAYALGYDGIVFNTQTRSFQPVNRAAAYVKRNRLHINKILPTLQNRLAKLCKSPPKFEIPPESNTQEDKDAARLSLQILDTKWTQMGMPSKRALLTMWLQQCGHSYVQVGWDPCSGKMMKKPESDEMDWEGDVYCEVVPPFEMFPDPHAKTFDDVLRSWIIRARVRPLEYFVQMYGEKGKEVKEESIWLLSAQYENRISGMNNRGPGAGGQPEGTKNCAIELIKWEAATREHPHGRVIVCAGDTLLKDEELPPTLGGMIPVAKFDDILVAGKYYPEAIVTHLRPIQDQLNDTIRRRAEWAKRFISGKYKAARGSGLTAESLNDSDSEVVYYDVVPNAPGGPEPIQVPQIPQFAYQEEEHLDLKFNELSGISEVSKGNIPSASIPALGMQLLVESDDTRIGVEVEQHEESYARVATLMLRFIEFGYVLPRKLKLGNKASQYNILEFQGQQLRGNTQVRVQRGSMLPGSKTLKRNDIMNAFQSGLLGDPNDPKLKEKVLGMIEFGDSQDMWEDYQLDTSQIKKGIDLLTQGEVPEISQFDNNGMWVAQINKLRKSDKYEILEQHLKDIIMGHMFDRVAAITDMMKPKMPPPEAPPSAGQIQQMATGGPDQNGQPS